MKIYSLTVVMVLFIMFCGLILSYFGTHNVVGGETVHSDIDWEMEFPYDTGLEDEENTNYINKRGFAAGYLEAMSILKNLIDNYSNARIMCREKMIIHASKVRRVMHWPSMEVEAANSIIKLYNGYLADTSPYIPDESLNKMANSVEDFCAFLEDRDVNFIFANAGSKVDPADTKLGDERELALENFNAKRLLELLGERGVDTIDFVEEMHNADMDWYKAYYVGDHHWTNETQLWAAGVLADKLNHDYGYEFDLSYFDIENYNVELYEHVFMGAEARTIVDYSYMEDYKLITPKFDTYFDVGSVTGLCKEGAFEETMIDKSLFLKAISCSDEELLSLVDTYKCGGITDEYTVTTVCNKLTNNKKKILFINDSFGWYLTSYLACDVSYLQSISPFKFNGSIRKYIEINEPDMVVMLLTSRNIKEQENGSLIGGFFDLR